GAKALECREIGLSLVGAPRKLTEGMQARAAVEAEHRDGLGRSQGREEERDATAKRLAAPFVELASEIDEHQRVPLRRGRGVEQAEARLARIEEYAVLCDGEVARGEPRDG